MPSLLSAVLGVPLPAPVAASPQTAASQAVSWPSQPFASNFYSDLRGRIEFEAARATILPSIAAQKLQGAVAFGSSGIAFEKVMATIGGGKASANAKFESGPSGLTLRGNAALAPADATAVIRAAAQTPVTGKLSGELVFESTGSSPAALIAGLRGGGLVALDNGKIAGLDAKAIDVAARATERGPVATPARVTEIVTKALDAGTLAVPTASVPVELANGRARLGKLVTPNANDVTLAGSLDLVEESVDLRFTLIGSGAADAQGLRPELFVLYKGPVLGPRRTVDVSSLTSWLTLQSVERKSRKLEAEEREAKRREALDALIREATRDPPAPAATGATPPAATPAVGASPASAAPKSQEMSPTAPANAAAPNANPARAPATGLFAPELPAPQLIPGNPRPASALPTPTPPSAALTTPVPSVPTPPAASTASDSVPPVSKVVPATTAAGGIAPNPGALPLNPPLPQPRPTANAQVPIELAPPARRDSHIETAPLMAPQ